MGTLIAAFVIHALTKPEPSYQGKRLSEWLEEDYPQDRYGRRDYRGLGPHPEETKQAIQAMGTKAVPSLLRMLGAKDSTLKTKCVALLEKGYFGKIPYTLAETDQDRAVEGFEALGPQAKSAFPELVRLFFYQTSSTSSAGCVLSRLGREGIPIFRAGLTNKDAVIRAEGAYYLGTYKSNAVAAVPGLLNCLGDSSAEVRTYAAWALGRISLEPETVLPALIGRLEDSDRSVRICSLRSIGFFGSTAAFAAPAISNTLSKVSPSDLSWKRETTNILKMILVEPGR